MIGLAKTLFRKVFGTRNQREVRKLQGLVDRINGIEESYQSLSDEELRARTREWQGRLSRIEGDAELAGALDSLLPEAFAAVKSACRRLWGSEIEVKGHLVKWEMIPFDVQLIGGYALHTGRIAEMATGEGKTLVATLPVYLNALAGRGVHIVTVNDYLASRDSQWMGAIYRFLGLSVGCILHDQPPPLRREQYQCDITYGTNSEFGFDYLRDNGMASRTEQQVQRGHYFAIVDEVDSILIDEARTPLIISGPAMVQNDDRYDQIKPQIQRLVQRQKRLCSGYLEEARGILRKLESGEATDGDRAGTERELGLLLYRAKMGDPKSPGLLKLLENPENLKIMNRAEMSLHSDQTKKELYGQKEDLYFAIEEKRHDADLTEKGRGFISPGDPDSFVLPDLTVSYHEIDSDPSLSGPEKGRRREAAQKDFEEKAQKIHAISQLLKAYCLYEKDVEYVVQNNEVVIVDENTGRLMTGRRWSDGLHQAVEAKEGVEIKRETQTYATITIQNYFRLYAKLAGMTGTAETEAGEFLEIYKLGVLVIPTNRPVARKDANDSVFKSRREKYAAVIEEIREKHREGRPILVGTVSVEDSELLDRMLRKERIPHSVLNAKYHEQEAEIVARAGKKGAVTIATNMAGRGTDIKLDPGVGELGGLHVIGTERHESRRIDRQLRGRCARQGDNGSSHFFVSLEDRLMRLFGSNWAGKIMQRVMEEGQEIEHPMLNRTLERAQKQCEQHNFQIRKHTLEYDDVMNKQREIVYGFRNEIMHREDVQERMLEIMEEVLVDQVEEASGAEEDPQSWDLQGLAGWMLQNFPVAVSPEELGKVAREGEGEAMEESGTLYEGLSPGQASLCRHLIGKVRDTYRIKAESEDQDQLQAVERSLVLSCVDRLWQEHLYAMDGLRSSIGLRAYGQRDPLLEYKSEAFKTFQDLMARIKREICRGIFRSATSLRAYESFLTRINRQSRLQDAASPGENPQALRERRMAQADQMVRSASQLVASRGRMGGPSKKKGSPVRAGPKIGRNQLCPCNSGKKYKNCCGRG